MNRRTVIFWWSVIVIAAYIEVLLIADVIQWFGAHCSYNELEKR